MKNVITQITEYLNKDSVQYTKNPKISEDGSTLIYSDWGAECALIFIKQDDQWVFQAKLTASDGVTGDCFGSPVSISSDGNTALIGAHGADPSGISDAGAAYVFTRVGSTWTQQAKLVASDGVDYDYFGYCCILSADGTLAQVFNRCNKEYTFTLVDGVWTENAKSKGN